MHEKQTNKQTNKYKSGQGHYEWASPPTTDKWNFLMGTEGMIHG